MLDVKKGDKVIVVWGHRSGPQECTVDAVGPKWITVGRSKFDRKYGAGEFSSILYTVDGYAAKMRRDEAEQRLRAWGVALEYSGRARGREEEIATALAPLFEGDDQ